VSAARPRRPGEHGLFRFRGCCIGLLVLFVLCAGAALLAMRITATPVLVTSPLAGPDDGARSQEIATALARQLQADLLKSPHGQASLLLSEHDLSVIAAQANPDPATFSDVQVRSRDGYLLVSADSHLGPLPIVVTVRLVPRLSGDGTLSVDIAEVDVGDQSIPGFMRSAIDPRGQDVLPAGLFKNLDLSSFGPDCLAVVAGGVELGFHSPTTPPNPGNCAALASG
jgi:hypothetical protein